MWFLMLADGRTCKLTRLLFGTIILVAVSTHKLSKSKGTKVP
jgi:hypothetical protein